MMKGYTVLITSENLTETPSIEEYMISAILNGAYIKLLIEIDRDSFNYSTPVVISNHMKKGHTVLITSVKRTETPSMEEYKFSATLNGVYMKLLIDLFI